MRIKDAPGTFDLSNKAEGESSTMRNGEKYDDYEKVSTNNMKCSGENLFDVDDDDAGVICATDGAPFEVFTTNTDADTVGDYTGKTPGGNFQHTANGQSVRTYRHDLDNTTMVFRACDADYSMWSYSRASFTYTKEDFNITHLIPPEEQIRKLDVTKRVAFPKNLGTFTFFGEDYDDCKMSGHGYISFGGTVGDDFTESISEWGKYKMVAALWDDFNPNGAVDPGTKMGIAKNIYAVHEVNSQELIFQWHFIPETSLNWQRQSTGDENVFRITLDFDTNDIIIKTGMIEAVDGIVGITGGLQQCAEGWQQNHGMCYKAATKDGCVKMGARQASGGFAATLGSDVCEKHQQQFGHHHVDFSSDRDCQAR
jgi:hypothetical protein